MRDDRGSIPGWEKAEEGFTTQLVFVLPSSHIVYNPVSCLRSRLLLKDLVRFCLYSHKSLSWPRSRDDRRGKAGRHGTVQLGAKMCGWCRITWRGQGAGGWIA